MASKIINIGMEGRNWSIQTKIKPSPHYRSQNYFGSQILSPVAILYNLLIFATLFRTRGNNRFYFCVRRLAEKRVDQSKQLLQSWSTRMDSPTNHLIKCEQRCVIFHTQYVFLYTALDNPFNHLNNFRCRKRAFDFPYFIKSSVLRGVKILARR